jgi:hypothetical protein
LRCVLTGALFRIMLRNTADPFMRSETAVHSSAAKALAVLTAQVARLATAGMLHDTSVDDATVHFRALCDGLAGPELGGAPWSDAGERLWRAGLAALIRGFTTPDV